MPSDIELLTQLAQDNARKLDQLIYELPQRYVDDKRHKELERRLDTVESRVQKIDDTIFSLHSNSMDAMNKMFAQATEKFSEESKAMRQEVNDLRVSIYRTIVMSVVIPVVVSLAVVFISHILKI